MSRRVISWPNIVATLVGGIGASGFFSAWPLTSSGGNTWIGFDWGSMATSVFLLILSYALAMRRDWARRILILPVILIGGYLTVRHAFAAFGPTSFSDVTPEQEKVIRLSTRLGEISSFFLALSLLVSFVLLLLHPDVVASFRDRPPAPEKALQ